MFFPLKNKAFVHISSSKIILLLGKEVDNKFIIKKLAKFKNCDELKVFIKEEKLWKADINVVLGSEGLFSRIILIPRVPHKEIKKILAWELRKYLSIEWEEKLIFDFKPIDILEISKEKIQGYLVVGGKEKYIQSYSRLLENLGLSIKMIDVEAMVLKNIYLKFERLKNFQDCCLYLDEDRAVLNFFQKQDLIYTTTFKFTNSSLGILQHRFFQSIDYLKNYQIEINLESIIVLGVIEGNFILKDIEKILNIEAVYIDVKDIYSHLEDGIFDNSYLLTLAKAFKEVNEK